MTSSTRQKKSSTGMAHEKQEAKAVKDKKIHPRATRFAADPMTLAYISIGHEEKFEPTVVALVANESFTGCAVVIATDQDLEKGLNIKIKVGNFDPARAEIAWVKPLDENIKKLGVKFLD